MLPKLQQSSIAQSLRKDNPTSLIQCNCAIMKARISWRLSYPDPIMNHTNHGKINMPPRIHIALSATSPQTTCPNKGLKPNIINPNMKSPSQENFSNIRSQRALEGSAPRHLKRKSCFLSQCRRAEPSKKEKFQLLSLENITIVEICPSKLTIKVLRRNSSGRCQLKPWTITTIFRSSWMAADRR